MRNRVQIDGGGQRAEKSRGLEDLGALLTGSPRSDMSGGLDPVARH